ncbi:ABC transporter ATP-binding protein [Amycolatopsis magusensis]|uniref:ATP-binding cassette subfamily C protein n=1 Tax=Amycolatopsis magusensis TaxID=882444 RepID=A0ABS4PL42_9PSEU|nr:ABC transporter ATP-binding protein [Amycolatopsis magusensis]MBP2180151.1 ATP-binding cassette subfamily C protein [Amycolatopsis magusensis]
MGISKLYWTSLGKRWQGGLILFGCSILESVPAFLSGRLVALSVDRGFAAGAPMTGVWWLLVFAGVAVAGALGSRLVWRQLGTVIEPIRDALVTAVVSGVLRNGATSRNAPDASGVARITQHVEVIRDATAGLLVQARGMLVTTVAALAGLFTVAGGLAWLVAIPVLSSLVLFACLLPALASRQRAVAVADERTAEVAGGVLVGMRDVVACGAERTAGMAVFDVIDDQARAAVRMAKATAMRTLVIAIGGFCPLVLVLVYAPGMVAAGELTAGAALGSLVYLATTMQPALQGLASTASTVVLRLLVALRRLSDVATEPPSSGGEEEPASPVVSVRGLTFGWGEHAEPVVRGLELDLSPGDHLAVVGPSGIGKSTLAGLLTGQLEPQDGLVRLGGVPVRSARPGSVHRMVALIPQEAYVFAGTVRENLALLTPDATDEHLHEAARAVGAGELIDRLGGLDGELGHAAEGLSAGQAQLLGLARVYASQAEVIILDEATSHLDPAAEAHAERAFAARGGVLVVIAHRLSSALRAGRLLVMDGDHTLLGTHEGLLAESARYAEMMRAWTGTPVRVRAS